MYLIITLLVANVFLWTHASLDNNVAAYGGTQSGQDTMTLVRRFLAKHRGGPRYRTAPEESTSTYTRPHIFNPNDLPKMSVGPRNLGGKRPNANRTNESIKPSNGTLKPTNGTYPEPNSARAINTTNPDNQISRNNDVKTEPNETNGTLNNVEQSVEKHSFDVNDVKKTLDGYKLAARSSGTVANNNKLDVEAMMQKLKAIKNQTTDEQPNLPPKNVNIPDEKEDLPNNLKSNITNGSNTTHFADVSSFAAAQPNASMIVVNTTESHPEEVTSKNGNTTPYKSSSGLTQQADDQYSTRSAGGFKAERHISSPDISFSSNQPSSFSSLTNPGPYSWNPPTNINTFPNNFGQEKSNMLNGCNIEGRFLLFGDKWSEAGICGLFTCELHHYRTVSTECPPLSYQEGSGCEIIEQDMSMEFPNCCPRLSCPDTRRDSKI